MSMACVLVTHVTWSSAICPVKYSFFFISMFYYYCTKMNFRNSGERETYSCQRMHCRRWTLESRPEH